MKIFLTTVCVVLCYMVSPIPAVKLIECPGTFCKDPKFDPSAVTVTCTGDDDICYYDLSDPKMIIVWKNFQTRNDDFMTLYYAALAGGNGISATSQGHIDNVTETVGKSTRDVDSNNLKPGGRYNFAQNVAPLNGDLPEKKNGNFTISLKMNTQDGKELCCVAGGFIILEQK